LDQLPDSLGYASDLAYLYLPNNQISELPSSVCSLKRLRSLMIAGNRNIRIPPEDCLENLKDLYINRSQLKVVPLFLRDRVSFVAERND
jgi:Leucine-rich repeat (LRR) protein